MQMNNSSYSSRIFLSFVINGQLYWPSQTQIYPSSYPSQLFCPSNCQTVPFLSPHQLTVASPIVKMSTFQSPQIFLQPAQSQRSLPQNPLTTKTSPNTPSNASTLTTFAISLYTLRIIGVMASKTFPGYGTWDSGGNGQSWRMHRSLLCMRHASLFVKLMEI